MSAPSRAVQLGSTEPTHRQLLEPTEAWMKNSRRRNLTQAAACLICAIPAWRYSFVLEGTEFRGSRATGWLVSRCRRVPASPGVGSDLPISPNCSGSYGCRLRALFAALPVRGSSRSFLSMGVPRKVYGFFSGGLCLGSMGRRRDRLGCHCALRMPRGSVGSFVATGMERHLSTAEVGRYYEGFSNGVL